MALLEERVQPVLVVRAATKAIRDLKAQRAPQARMASLDPKVLRERQVIME
jgi:hypothetical protein